MCLIFISGGFDGWWH